jgi:hypothetical protein
VGEFRGVRSVYRGERGPDFSGWLAEFSDNLDERYIEEREIFVESHV